MSTPIPTPKTSRNETSRRGFIILAIFIALIGASYFLPVFGSANLSAKITTASINASGIYKAIRLYAQDHDGKFPEGVTNSNEAFRQLFPDYMEDEKVFFVANSPWHRAAPNHQPDNDIGSRPDYVKCLEKGENHWAYVSGLSLSSPPKTPLIADGFVEGNTGVYTDVTTQKGGVWKGTKAIVVFADGSAEQFPLSPTENFRVMVKKPGSKEKVDLFTREGGLPENAKVLNPE